MDNKYLTLYFLLRAKHATALIYLCIFVANLYKLFHTTITNRAKNDKNWGHYHLFGEL
jgi:hypothetical protein